MLKSLVRVALVAAVVIVTMLPLTASAAGGPGGGTSNGMTLTIGNPISLQNHLLITVPVTVTCVAPISVDPTFSQPGGLGVTVEQASKNTVAIGEGNVELDSCSPAPQTFLVQVTPNLGPTATAPFHGGPAIVSANGVICDANFPQTCYFGSTPWQPTKL